MFDYIEGKLIEKMPAHVVIDCGGVGYFLNISLHTYSKIGASGHCKLYVHQAIREDAHMLFGFQDHAERSLFRLLISVSGVGAGTARMILSSLSPVEIQQAIATGNVSALKSVKGIGEKTAQRIIVDLKGKAGKEDLHPGFLSAAGNTVKNEALSALVMLGFSKNMAEKAVDKILHTEPDSGVEQLVKAALKNL